MTKKSRAKFITDIFEEHLEEIAILWNRRQLAIRSPEHFLSDVIEIDGRIKAHLKGLLVGGDAAIPFAAVSLNSDDIFDVFAAVYFLVSLGSDEAIDIVVEAYVDADPSVFAGFAEGIHAAGMRSRLKEALIQSKDSDDPLLSASSIAILALSGEAIKRSFDLASMRSAESADLRQLAWRITAYLDGTN